jgi:recombination protein RecA
MALDSFLKQMNKKHGEGSMMMMGGGGFEIETLPSGIPELDSALGGGFPLGRIMEIFGPESSGKTTISLYMAASAQKHGKNVAFIDLENALDPSFAKDIVGVDIDNLLISQPGSAEVALEIVLDIVRSGEFALVIVDSVATLIPEAEIKGDMGDSHMGLVARLMSQALRKINQAQTENDAKCTVVFINQIREKIGVMFGSPETTPGGRALKFYSSVRLDIRSPNGKVLKEGDEVVGKQITAKTVKNKVAPPFKSAVFDLMFDTGVDETRGLFNVALQQGVIVQKGAHYYDGASAEKLGQGKNKVLAHLEENPEYAQEIRSRLT